MGQEPNPKDNGDHYKKMRELLSAIDHSVGTEDFDFTLELAAQQSILTPVEVAGYMHSNLVDAENEEKKVRWSNALTLYLERVLCQDLPDDQAEKLVAMVEALSDDLIEEPDYSDAFDDIEDGDTQVATKAESYDWQDPQNWDDDEFKPDVDEEEAKRVQSLPVYREAKEAAEGERFHADFETAYEIIDDNVEGELANTMYLLLEAFVFKEAEIRAQTDEHSMADIPFSVELISEWGASDESEARMRSALDKYVYQEAQRMADGEAGRYAADLPGAKRLIEDFASTWARHEAMLERLGYR